MDQSPLVLVVDDEPGVLRLVELELLVQGFRVITASDGDEALKRVAVEVPDIAILDVVMPRMSGLELMGHLKERFDMPVILLTAKTSTQDRFRGLELGADDYIEKPFVPEDLTERVGAVVKRLATGRHETIAIGGLEIDLKRRIVTRDGQLITLSRTEWMLLQQLAAHRGVPLAGADILEAVWGLHYRNDLEFLRAWIGRLRAKIEPGASALPVIAADGTGAYVLGSAAPASGPESVTPPQPGERQPPNTSPRFAEA